LLFLKLGNDLGLLYSVGLILFFVELYFKTFTVRASEFSFRSADNADGDEEAEETNKWVDESNNLPEVVVASISFAVFVEIDVGLEVPHHEGE